MAADFARPDEGTPVPSPRRTKATRVTACAAALCLAILVSPTAQAAPTKPVIPSKQAVQDAQQKVADTQTSVSSIEAQLAAADSQLASLGVAAGKASDAYDGAVYRYQLAQRAATAAKRRADHAVAAAASSRSGLAGYVVSHETAGTQLTTLGAAMTATGTTSLINQMADYSTTSSALDARLQQWRAQSRLARVYQKQAKAALVTATAAKRAAAEAKQLAAAAVAQQQAAVSSIAAQKTALIGELAAAQHTSVRLASQRAQGLEQLRQERLAAARRAAALERRRAEQRQERIAEQRQQRLAEQRRQRIEQRREQRQQHQDPSNPAPPPPPPPLPPPPPPPPTPPPPPPSGGAAAAIAFAYAQLGEPYVYGAAGPDAWDCSGLTMGAWGAAGVSLPHYTVAQYESMQHISFGELQPGDLVFWGGSSPSTIYHVALYIGNNEIIQAPHPGAYVEVSSIYDWILPNYFGRV